MNNFNKLMCKIFNWSWLLTLPITLLFIVWAVNVGHKYWDFGIRYVTFDNAAQLLHFGKMEFSHLTRAGQLLLTRSGTSSINSIPHLNLYLKDSAEKTLNSNLPHSGRKYVKARLRYPNGKIHKVKMKYRGDFDWHWAFYKKSIRIKTKKKKLFSGMRSFNLIAPKFSGQLHNYLSYVLAEDMGILSPHAEMINLSINGENRGVHLLVEQLEEMVLRKNDRMPGDLYAGELIARDRYRGVSSKVFEHPKLWEKKAVNNHFHEDSFAPIEKLCQLLTAEKNENTMAELRALVDLKAFGKFSAFRTLVQSFHFDGSHNWRLYYDPWRNVFEPIVWDVAGWHPGWLPQNYKNTVLDIITSMLDERLMRDHQFLVARQKAFEDFFASGIDKKFLAQVDHIIEQITPAISRDPSLVAMYKMYSPHKVIDHMGKLRRTIEKLQDEIRDKYLTCIGDLNYSIGSGTSLSLKLSYNGRQPLQQLQFNFTQPLKEVPAVFITYWIDKQKHTIDISGLTTVRGTALIIQTPITAQFVRTKLAKAHGLMKIRNLIKPSYYELTFQGVTSSQDSLVEIVGYGSNDRQLRATKVDDLEVVSFHDAYGIVLPAPLIAPEVLQGIVSLDSTRTIKNNVIIMPGTTIRMNAGVSLIIEGRLLAKGTAEEPIKIIPAEANQGPWGVIALRGEKANDSEVQYCEFSGGSGLKEDLFEYSAMFSIHNVRGVVVSHCRFMNNHVVDDMVHAVYAEITFSDCLFERSLADALDIDISTAIIDRCKFVNSGNDSLDLMSSQVVVRDTEFQSSSDKGISVGENTRLLGVNLEMRSNEIGVQVKDSSYAMLYNVDFLNNKKAVDAYKKNWRYDGGGTVNIYKAHMLGNMSNFTADKKSMIFVYDSYVEGTVKKTKRVVIDSTVDAKKKRNSQVEKLWLAPENRERTSELFSPYWSDVNPAVRGYQKASFPLEN